MNGYLMFAAVLLLFLAHVTRCIRWTQLFPAHYLKRRLNLLVGLSVGYVVAAILPYRLGELFRILYVTKCDRIRFAYVAATVAAERLSDLVVVALLLAALIGAGLTTGSGWIWTTLIITLTFVMLYGLAKAIAHSVWLRRGIWRVASVFNDEIRLAVTDFFWSFSLLVNNNVLRQPKFIGLTLLMWTLYAASYVTFSVSVGVTFSDVIYQLFGSPLTSMADLLLNPKTLPWGLQLLLFTSTPVLTVVLYSFAYDRTQLSKMFSDLRHFGTTSFDHFTTPTSDRFKDRHEYYYFLTSLFSSDERLVTSFGLTAIEDGVIHRLFTGGSDAITALCEVSDRLIIRKFGIGAAAGKLREQEEWLRAHRLVLPLVKLLDKRVGSDSYRYDMPYFPNASDFYDVIHTTPIEPSCRILDNVIDRVDALHRRTQGAQASTETLRSYLTTKATNNAKIVLDFAQALLEDRLYYVNREKFDLSMWDYLLDEAWLLRQITDRRTAVIHGDLTVENIIVYPSESTSWYLIDPNPDNIFNSPLIDWAKMLQSLHLGYEVLNRGVPVSFKGAEIFVSAPKSLAYQKLHEHFLASIEKQADWDVIADIHFHELVNYLRLTPYKIRRNPTSGLIFFACTSLILREYIERYGR